MSGVSSLESLETTIVDSRKQLAEAAHVAIITRDAGLRERLVYALEGRGRVSHAFDSGEAYLDWLTNRMAVVVVVQLSLPGISGLELMNQVRADHPLVEFIALASQPDAETAVQCLAAGAQDLFALPLEQEDLLLSRIAAAMERWRRSSTDQRVSDQFQAFANKLLRLDDVKHRGALARFRDNLMAFKRELSESPEIIFVTANQYAGARVKAFLESEGYRVSMYDSVKAATAGCVEREPRLLLAEAELADGTAFDAYQQIGRFHPDIEFLVISPANAADIAIAAMENGARDCILKPHEGLEAMQRKVRRALRLQATHAKHQRLVDELRKLCTELVRLDAEAQSTGAVMIKVDPGRSQATLTRMLAELNREEQKRLRRARS